MFCPNCGTQNDDQAIFCKSCGASLKAAAPPVQPAVTANTIPTSPVISTITYAGFWKRFAAFLIDYIILGAVFSILALAFIPNFFTALEVITGPVVFVYFLTPVIYWLYFALLESSKIQATVGKLALGIKVTNLNGGRISFANATGRFFSKIISGLILYIGYFMIAFTAKKQGLHDMFASTLVVDK
jgi:uncharacterized RDD family membrane protein YckC